MGKAIILIVISTLLISCNMRYGHIPRGRSGKSKPALATTSKRNSVTPKKEAQKLIVQNDDEQITEREVTNTELLKSIPLGKQYQTKRIISHEIKNQFSLDSQENSLRTNRNLQALVSTRDSTDSGPGNKAGAIAAFTMLTGLSVLGMYIFDISILSVGVLIAVFLVAAIYLSAGFFKRLREDRLRPGHTISHQRMKLRRIARKFLIAGLISLGIAILFGVSFLWFLAAIPGMIGFALLIAATLTFAFSFFN